jgi:hypothetical protein
MLLQFILTNCRVESMNARALTAPPNSTTSLVRGLVQRAKTASRSIDTTRTISKIRRFSENKGVLPVIPRLVFFILVAGLSIFVVAFAVLMAFYALVTGLGDLVAARALLWTAMACLVVAAVDLVLLVGALGLQATQQQPRQRGE